MKKQRSPRPTIFPTRSIASRNSRKTSRPELNRRSENRTCRSIQTLATRRGKRTLQTGISTYPKTPMTSHAVRAMRQELALIARPPNPATCKRGGGSVRRPLSRRIQC